MCMASRRPVVTAAAVRTVKGRWRQAARAAAATAAAGSEAAGLAVAARRGAPLTPPGWERIIGGLRVRGLGSEPKPLTHIRDGGSSGVGGVGSAQDSCLYCSAL